LQFFVSEGMRYVMGTLLRVTIQGTSQHAVEAAKDLSLNTAQRLEEKLSRHRADSELSKISRGALEASDASPETRDALALAQRLKDITGGTFDPHMGGTWDLGAFGKGFALDHALDAVVRIPEVFAFRFDFGGQLVFWDREDHVSEVVVIELPGFTRNNLPEFLMKRRGSISTSALFERGKHIRDPRTGQEIDARRSVTVIAPTAAEADAWSTALFVLGAGQGLPLVERHPELEALFIEMQGDAFTSAATRGWPSTKTSNLGVGTIHRPPTVYNKP